MPIYRQLFMYDVDNVDVAGFGTKITNYIIAYEKIFYKL